jgi:hypothetical protein
LDHRTTRRAKDNNQFYDVETGLLAGYRFESYDASKTSTIVSFNDYKNFGGPLIVTKRIFRAGDHTQTVTFTRVSYEPVSDSRFELPPAVKTLAM